MKQENTSNQADAVRKLAKDHDTGRAAFAEIYNRYAPGIYRTGLQHLQSDALAEDLVQEVFSQVWANRKNFTHVQDLKRYLYVMAKNEAYRQFKKLASEEKTHKEFSKRKEISDTDGAPAPGIPIGSDRDGIAEQYEHLLSTVEELSPRQKEIFELAKLHGLSHKEIADQLDISPKTVNNHITQALRYVRENGKLPITSIILLLLVTA